MLIPSAKIPFGAAFSLIFTFTSAQKEFNPGHITIQVIETHLLKVTPTASEAIKYGNSLPITIRKDCTILQQTYTEQKYTNSEADLLGLESSTTILIHLPPDLQACIQDVHSELIKVRHELHLEADFEIDAMQRDKAKVCIYTPELAPCSGRLGPIVQLNL